MASVPPAYIAHEVAHYPMAHYLSGPPDVTVDRPTSSEGDLLLMMSLKDDGTFVAAINGEDVTAAGWDGVPPYLWKIVESGEPSSYLLEFSPGTELNQGVASRVVLASYSIPDVSERVSPPLNILRGGPPSLTQTTQYTDDGYADSLAVVCWLHAWDGTGATDISPPCQWGNPTGEIALIERRSVQEQMPFYLGDAELPADPNGASHWVSVLDRPTLPNITFKDSTQWAIFQVHGPAPAEPPPVPVSSISLRKRQLSSRLFTPRRGPQAPR